MKLPSSNIELRPFSTTTDPGAITRLRDLIPLPASLTCMLCAGQRGEKQCVMVGQVVQCLLCAEEALLVEAFRRMRRESIFGVDEAIDAMLGSASDPTAPAPPTAVVAVGQRYRSRDKRDPGRVVQVISIERRPGHVDRAVVRGSTGRTTRLSIYDGKIDRWDIVLSEATS